MGKVDVLVALSNLMVAGFIYKSVFSVDAFRTISVLPRPVCSPFFFVDQLLNPFIISDPNVIIDPSCNGSPGLFLCVLFLEKTSSIQAKHPQSWISSKVCDFSELGSVRWSGML